MKYGILWDLDGTLLDTLQDLTDATNYALRQFGYPERTLAGRRRFVGNGALRQMEQAVPAGADAKEVLAVYKSYYNAHCQIKTAPYPGVPEALKILGERYPMAIVSNKPDTAVKALCDQYFPGIYARGERPDCPRKPAPDMVLRTLADMGVECCIYVGDSEVDILTANNAGVPCLSVLWGFRDRDVLEAAGGTHFCEEASELAEKIEEMIHAQ